MFLLSDIKSIRAGLENKNEAVKEKVHVLQVRTPDLIYLNFILI